MSEKNYKCVVAYDGTGYHGWQKQESFETVQGVIEYALEKLFEKKISVTAASRTDSGVHAHGNVFNFKVKTPYAADGIRSLLNTLLPSDIKIMSCRAADDRFSARTGAKKKFYRYMIWNRPNMLPVHVDFAWHFRDRINADKIREIIPLFIGMKNYLTFSAASSDAKRYERELKSITVSKKGPWIIIDYKGKSFLHNMLRKVTAALVYYAKGSLTRAQVEKMFEKQDRSLMQYMAPPQGLYLVKIIY